MQIQKGSTLVLKSSSKKGNMEIPSPSGKKDQFLFKGLSLHDSNPVTKGAA